MILEGNGVNKKNFKLNLEFFLLTTFFDLATFLLMNFWYRKIAVFSRRWKIRGCVISTTESRARRANKIVDKQK